MTHPDDEISFFNDAALEVAPSPTELHRYAGYVQKLPLARPGTVHLQHSGYARLESEDAVLLADIGDIGPDYLPGHAHADTLSFELSIYGQRVVINSGTSRYGVSPERARQRGTAAHSTVCVDGEDSSEVWSGFRVARRARALDAQLDSAERSSAVSASHDGYQRLRGGGLHRRSWDLSKRKLQIEDRWTGHLPAESRLHLHPHVSATLGDGRVVITLPSGQTIQVQSPVGEIRIQPSTYHPKLGIRLDNQVLSLPLADGTASIGLSW